MRLRMKNQKRKILIFLDVDGVLNTSNSFNTKYQICEKNAVAFGELVRRFETHGQECRVILTSTWRLGYEKEFEKCSEQVQRLILKLGEVGVVIEGRTPIYRNQTRDVEIMRYIREYELQHDDFTYIILDDDVSEFCEEVLCGMNYYKVNQNTGLTMKDVVRIEDALHRK